MIGAKYRYPEPNNKQEFTLHRIVGCIYWFDCGHWVTDLVFEDMIQLTLF